MSIESQPSVNGESKSSQSGGGFETSKESNRRRRKERRADRERAHERAHAALEPLTIWVRSDPNHLQHSGQPQVESADKPKGSYTERVERKNETKISKQERVQASKKRDVETTIQPVKQEQIHLQEIDRPAKVAAPKIEAEITIPVPEESRSNNVKDSVIEPSPHKDLPVFQELPRLDIRPRHFYTEPEVRQPNQALAEHDILPPTGLSGDRQPVLHSEQTNAEMATTTGKQLQELAEQKTKRAEELERKNLESQELLQINAPSASAEINEHVRAITGEQPEADSSMGMDELLIVGDSIRIEGVSISEMFRAERIDEEGLRRIVADFLRGQRIEKIVTEEVLRLQMRFERDPQLRQIPITAMQDSQASRIDEANQQRRVFNTKTMRRQADRIADRLAERIDRTVEAAENNPNIAKTVGTVVAVIAYFVVLILIIRS